MGRKVSQGPSFTARDLKELSLMYDRAVANITRSNDRNDRIKELLTELIDIYTLEKHENDRKKPVKKVA